MQAALMHISLPKLFNSHPGNYFAGHMVHMAHPACDSFVLRLPVIDSDGFLMLSFGN